jgi:hypothetical protein
VGPRAGLDTEARGSYLESFKKHYYGGQIKEDKMGGNVERTER